MIEIKRNTDVILDDQKIDFDSINKRDFIIANLWNETKIQEGMTLEELVHFFYDIKEFVYEYFCEHYEVTRALVTMGNLGAYYDHMRFYKTLSIESEVGEEDKFIFIDCNVEIKKYNSNPKTHGIDKVAQLPIFVDDVVYDESEKIGEKVKTKFFLMDFMEMMFDEVPNLLKHDAILV